MNEACSAQGIKALPYNLAGGQFHLVKRPDHAPIYRYEFATRRGCRAIDPNVHGTFPGSTDDLLSNKKLFKYRDEHMHGLAKYIDGAAEEVEVHIEGDGVKAVYMYREAKEPTFSTESDVQSHILDKLSQEKLKDKCKVCISSKKECLMSQFSGGGDIEIKFKSQQAVLSLGGSCGEQEEGDDEQSPVHSDEVRLGSNIELKHKQREMEESIELQLRANMLLCLARELESILVNYTSEELLQLNMTIYGLTFGYRSLHLLLKLTVDFRAAQTTATVRYRSNDSVGWAVEGSISYILSKMMAKSSPTPTPPPPPPPPPPRLQPKYGNQSVDKKSK